MTRDARPRFDPWLGIALAIGLGLRLLYFTSPYADAHRWRQLENLSIAWNFAHGSMNPFYPQAIWGGLQDAYVEMEFPVVPYMLAVAWRLFGEHDLYGRVIAIVSSLVLIAAVYALGRQLFSRETARGATLLMAISPTAVFFGRVPMTDTPMIACSTLAVLGYAKYFDTGSRAWAIGAAAAAMGAWLLKVPALLILGPIVIIGWQARGWRVLIDPLFVGGLAIAFLGMTAWYLHALRLYQSTGWTVGIWHPAGQHPAWIGTPGTPSAWSLWSTRELLLSAEFYKRLIDRAYWIHFTPIGLGGALFGAVEACRRPRGLVVLTWTAAALAFTVVVGTGNFWHEYYQLPLIPPVALLFGLGAGTLFHWPEDSSARWSDALANGARVLIILVMASAAFYYSSALRTLFRSENPDLLAIEAGEVMKTHVPPGDAVITLEYAQGPNSPVLLYYMRHRGWSFDTLTISREVIERLKAKGATHFATTEFSVIESKAPEMAEYLRTMREVPLGDRAPADAKLFELH